MTNPEHATHHFQVDLLPEKVSWYQCLAVIVFSPDGRLLTVSLPDEDTTKLETVFKKGARSQLKPEILRRMNTSMISIVTGAVDKDDNNQDMDPLRCAMVEVVQELFGIEKPTQVDFARLNLSPRQFELFSTSPIRGVQFRGLKQELISDSSGDMRWLARVESGAVELSLPNRAQNGAPSPEDVALLWKNVADKIQLIPFLLNRTYILHLTQEQLKIVEKKMEGAHREIRYYANIRDTESVLSHDFRPLGLAALRLFLSDSS